LGINLQAGAVPMPALDRRRANICVLPGVRQK
jgi:hypothetical protein